MCLPRYLFGGLCWPSLAIVLFTCRVYAVYAVSSPGPNHPRHAYSLRCLRALAGLVCLGHGRPHRLAPRATSWSGNYHNPGPSLWGERKLGQVAGGAACRIRGHQDEAVGAGAEEQESHAG